MRKKRVTLKELGVIFSSLSSRMRLKLHSIPILINNKLSLKNNKLRYISYSIPLASIVALLLVFSMATSPDLQLVGHGVVYAEESQRTSDSPAKSASISISGQGINDIVAAAPGTTAYRSHNVEIQVSDAKSYTLALSGPTNLRTPAGSEKQITGADNKQGKNMTEYTWGYAWGDTTADSDVVLNDDRYYQTVDPAGTNLLVPSLNDGSIEFSRKLVFAAKFGINAVVGNYTAPVTLSLAIVPKTASTYWRTKDGGVTAHDAGSTTMQGISSGFCKNNEEVGVGWTVDLEDIRETNKTYTVVKLDDGNCWMQENLSLPGNTNASNNSGNELTTADTDFPLDGNWLLPDVPWSNSYFEGRVQVGGPELEGWEETYGNYYNWCAATAGTCETTDSIAAGSICPKNWKLPSPEQYNQLKKIAFNSPDDTIKMLSGYYKFVLAGNLDRSGRLQSMGKLGYYFSNSGSLRQTTDGDIGGSLRYLLLDFNEDTKLLDIVIESDETHPLGMSVRCIASF